MRLPDFILANVEPILSEWEGFALGIWPKVPESTAITPRQLRDDAGGILLATVRDMASFQTPEQQSDKARGVKLGGASSVAVNRVSVQHGRDRFVEGFELLTVVAEYRALRASVLRLWWESEPVPDAEDLADITRFNESIDQSLTEAVRSFTERVDRGRAELLDNERSARQEAETANREKDIFLATLSHEMRTPLNAIVGWIDILRADGPSEGRIAQGLDVIERNTRAQVKLIEDVLDISRIVSGKMRLDLHECDLREPIKAGIDAVRPAARERDIRLDVDLGPSRRTRCDPTRFQQIVWNLLSNAIKFTPKGGRVHVGLARDGSNLRLTVRDNGQGISPDQLPHVFDRFRQADSGSRGNLMGLGLGLNIVQHLVEVHGGTVEAHSEGEHRGATFTVRVPVGDAEVQDPASGKGSGGGTV